MPNSLQVRQQPELKLHYERWLLAFILAVYLFLTISLSFGPIFEGPDEIEHYRYVDELAHTGELPDARDIVHSEYHQAPLYYVMLWPVALLVDGADFSKYDGRLNPFFPYQMTIPGNDNKNKLIHSVLEQFPYSESSTALAVHLMRLFSIAMGAGTLLTSLAIFRLLWPTHPDRRLLAIGIAAFTPGFLYTSSTLNNDNLLILLCTLTLYLLLRLHHYGPSWRLAFWLGLVVGAALLTKVTALFLVFPVGLAVLLMPQSWRYMALTLGMIVVVAGWWYTRNLILYGDPLSVRLLVENSLPEGIRGGSLALDIGIPRAFYAYQTYWARFSAGAISVDSWIYTFFNGITIAALFGLLIRLVQYVIRGVRRDYTSNLGWQATAIVITFGLTWIVSIVYFSSVAYNGNQGRYALPGLAAWAVLITWGLNTWTPTYLRMGVALSGMALLAFIAVLCTFYYILPAYLPSPSLGTIEHPLSFYYTYHNTEVAELVGVSPAVPKGQPGDVLHITLYWRALRPTDQELQVYLHSVDSSVVERDSLPGTGNLLSTEWRAGQIWAENYVVPISADAKTQLEYPLVAGLYDPANYPAVTVTDALGNSALPIIAHIAINGPQTEVDAEANNAIDFKFGDVIGMGALRMTRTGDQVQVCLRWFSLASTPTNYHVFMHILEGENSNLVGQADFEPKSGRYPTSAWTPGEAIDDCATIVAPNLPQNGWRIGIGLYNFETGQRLPARDAQAFPLVEDTVFVTPPH